MRMGRIITVGFISEGAGRSVPDGPQAKICNLPRLWRKEWQSVATYCTTGILTSPELPRTPNA